MHKPQDIPRILRGAPTFILIGVTLIVWMAGKESGLARADPRHYSLFHMPIDTSVYYKAGERLNAGGLLYDDSRIGHLPFTYPPFAGALFRWWGTLEDSIATDMWQTMNFVALLAVILMVLRNRKIEMTTGSGLVAVLIAVCSIAYEPVRGSFYYGQINLLLMLLICLDFLPKDRRFAGIGVGLAAGLKLTPAFFILIFIIERRWHALGTSLATFAGTVAIGFIFVPDAKEFWTTAIFNSGRIGAHQNPGAISIKSYLIRYYNINNTWVWLALVLVAVALVAAVVFCALRRDNMPMAVACTGIGACLVSPFSWYHHWVWIVPLVTCAIATVPRWTNRNWFIAQAGMLAAMVPIALFLWPYSSQALWPQRSFLGAAQTPGIIYDQMWIFFPLAVMLGYIIYATVQYQLHTNSTPKTAAQRQEIP